jgi:hypothetical protein
MLTNPDRQLALAESWRGTPLALEELELGCLALGGDITLGQLDAFLHGALRPTAHEYNVIAVAVNEYLAETGRDESVPYIEDVTFARRDAFSANFDG